MIFYQAHTEKKRFSLRSTLEESIKDLKRAGYEICGLRSPDNLPPLFDPNRNIGVGVIRV